MKKQNTKPQKNLPKGWDKETHLQVGVVLEGLRSDFKVFGDGLSFVQAKLDIVIKDIEVLKEDVAALKIGFSIMREDMEVMKKEIKEDMEVMKKEIKEDMEVMKKDIKKEIKEDMEVMKKDIKKDIKEDMEVMKKDIKAELSIIKNDLADIRYLLTQKSDLNRLENLEIRVQKIEEELQNH